MNKKEPEIHSHITDLLPEIHPLAFRTIPCQTCSNILHAANNECMRTWVETGKGNYCLLCFIKLLAEEDSLFALEDEIGLEI